MTGEVKAKTPLIAQIASDKVLCYISMALLVALPVVELVTEILKSTKMKAFRAYFKFVDILTDVENANAKISINFIEGTSIKGVYETPSTNKVYTVNGIEVNDNGNLPKGIYIINGKKIVK